MEFNPLTALSPLDGRYAGKVDALREHFSEFGLIRARLKVEIEWLKALAAEPHFSEIAPFSPSTAVVWSAPTARPTTVPSTCRSSPVSPTWWS